MGSLTVADRGGLGPLEWAVAARALPGQSLSGDAYVVLSHAAHVTMAVIDGIGHGPDAADAAEQAVEAIRALPEEPLEVVIEHCHEALRESRGAAVTVLQVGLDDGIMSWLGVGNVDAWILRRDIVGMVVVESALPANGVLGAQMPILRPRTVQLRGGDVIIMATDGVAPSWTHAVRPGQTVTTTAQHILDEHARSADDALVLAGRYRGFP